MAGFCIKCGAPIPDGVNFCQKCGAKITQSVTPQQNVSKSPPVQTQSPYNQDQEKKSKNRWLLFLIPIIIIIVVVILLVLLLSGGGSGSFIGKWNVVEHSSQGELYTSNVWTFCNDGNMTMEIEGLWPVGTHTYNYDWSIENGRIYSSDISSPFSALSGCRYEILDGGNTIKIYDTFDESKLDYTLTRIS